MARRQASATRCVHESMARPGVDGRPSLYSSPVNAEFNWWLLIVGLVVGAGLVWFVVADARRREHEVDTDERPREALWLATVMEREGMPVGPEAAERLLELHRAYLDSPPPDDPDPQDAEVSTGSDPTMAPSGPTSETPNVSPPASPATAGDGPTQ